MRFNFSLILFFLFITFNLTLDVTNYLVVLDELNYLVTQNYQPLIIYGFMFFTKLVKSTYLITQNYFINLTSISSIKTLTINSLVFTFKFLLAIALLVFIRGGVPRYRYDFLTKIGWIKFLSLVLSIFLSSLLLVYLF